MVIPNKKNHLANLQGQKLLERSKVEITLCLFLNVLETRENWSLMVGSLIHSSRKPSLSPSSLYSKSRWKLVEKWKWDHNCCQLLTMSHILPVILMLHLDRAWYSQLDYWSDTQTAVYFINPRGPKSVIQPKYLRDFPGHQTGGKNTHERI